MHLQKMNNYIKPLYNNILYKNSKILFPCFIGKHVIFEGPNFVGRFAHLSEIKIGRYTYLGNCCEFSKSKIGAFCSIAKDVKIIIGTHPTSHWVSTHPIFFSKHCYVGNGFIDRNRFNEFKTTLNGYYCEIGNDVWIGSNVSIMQGITIGDGAIIGANSLVTKDIPPYSIAVGSPAIVIRKRFTDEQIETLEQIQWWNWDIKKIIKEAPFFNDIKNFINNI